MSDQDITFTSIWIYRHDHIHVASIIDEVVEDTSEHALVFSYVDGQWKYREINNAHTSLCVIEEPTPKVFNLTADGEVRIFELPGFATEIIDSSDEGPSDLLQMRCIRPIGRRLYAAGMARRVYRRDAPNTWVPVDQGTFVPRDQRHVAVGFNTIGGLSEEAIYAAGYKGEIWFYDGQVWEQQASPANVALTSLAVVEDGTVYICGLAGMLIAGRRGQWLVIEQDVTEDDFWGITEFRGRIYVSAYDGVFRLDDNELVRINMGLKIPVSTAYLDARDGVMWSVGQKHLVVTENGVDWQLLPNP